MSLLRTLVAGGTAIGLTGSLAPVVSVLSFRDQRLPDPLIHFWARTVLRAAGVRSVARGVENVPHDRTFVMALNHQSHFDVLVLFSHVEAHMRFVAKADLFKIPVFGAAVKAAGNIKVDRDGGQGDRSRMREAVAAVREKVSIVFFAEGTRSDDGVLGPFKKGAATLAISAQVPIIPAAIAGTRNILPKGSKRIRGGQATALVIGEAIDTHGLKLEDRDDLTERTRNAVAALLEEANGLVAER
jgi:1-acyl-sn-glycerol-3-phosphate acyltransferase